MKLILFLFTLGCTLYSTGHALSQIEMPSEKPSQLRVDSKRPSQDNVKSRKQSEPDEEAKKFAESVIERNMDQLFEAISEFDQGNFNLIGQIGMSSSPLGRGQIVYKQVLFDARVIKLREFLSALRKDEAAERVKREFSSKFQSLQEIAAENFKFRDGKSDRYSFALPPASHGLSATLYLSSEFCDHDTFTQQYKQWLNWYRGERAKRMMELHATKEKRSKNQISANRYSEMFNSASEFTREGGPDRLFFINLCAVRALRRGVEFDTLQQWLSELNEEFEIKLPKFNLIEMKRFDPVKNKPRPEKIKFPMIYDYGDYVTILLCDAFMEWNPQKGKIDKELQDRNDHFVERVMEWSQPNLIRKCVRESRKSFLKWSSETLWLAGIKRTAERQWK
jgi:hypothetical protein